MTKPRVETRSSDEESLVPAKPADGKTEGSPEKQQDAAGKKMANEANGAVGDSSKNAAVETPMKAKQVTNADGTKTTGYSIHDAATNTNKTIVPGKNGDWEEIKGSKPNQTDKKRDGAESQQQQAPAADQSGKSKDSKSEQAPQQQQQKQSDANSGNQLNRSSVEGQAAKLAPPDAAGAKGIKTSDSSTASLTGSVQKNMVDSQQQVPAGSDKNAGMSADRTYPAANRGGELGGKAANAGGADGAHQVSTKGDQSAEAARFKSSEQVVNRQSVRAGEHASVVEGLQNKSIGKDASDSSAGGASERGLSRQSLNELMKNQPGPTAESLRLANGPVHSGLTPDCHGVSAKDSGADLGKKEFAEQSDKSQLSTGRKDVIEQTSSGNHSNRPDVIEQTKSGKPDGVHIGDGAGGILIPARPGGGDRGGGAGGGGGGAGGNAESGIGKTPGSKAGDSGKNGGNGGVGGGGSRGDRGAADEHFTGKQKGDKGDKGEGKSGDFLPPNKIEGKLLAQIQNLSQNPERKEQFAEMIQKIQDSKPHLGEPHLGAKDAAVADVLKGIKPEPLTGLKNWLTDGKSNPFDFKLLDSKTQRSISTLFDLLVGRLKDGEQTAARILTLLTDRNRKIDKVPSAEQTRTLLQDLHKAPKERGEKAVNSPADITVLLGRSPEGRKGSSTDFKLNVKELNPLVADLIVRLQSKDFITSLKTNDNAVTRTSRADSAIKNAEPKVTAKDLPVTEVADKVKLGKGLTVSDLSGLASAKFASSLESHTAQKTPTSDSQERTLAANLKNNQERTVTLNTQSEKAQLNSQENSKSRETKPAVPGEKNNLPEPQQDSTVVLRKNNPNSVPGQSEANKSQNPEERTVQQAEGTFEQGAHAFIPNLPEEKLGEAEAGDKTVEDEVREKRQRMSTRTGRRTRIKDRPIQPGETLESIALECYGDASAAKTILVYNQDIKLSQKIDNKRFPILQVGLLLNLPSRNTVAKYKTKHAILFVDVDFGKPAPSVLDELKALGETITENDLGVIRNSN